MTVGQMKRHVTSFNATMLVMYTLAIAVAVWVGMSITDRDLPIGPAKVSIEHPDQIAPGGYLFIDVVVEYHRRCTATIHRRLYDVNGTPHSLPTVEFGPNEIGIQHSPWHFPIDYNFPPGPAKYWSQVSYYCTAFQHWIWPIPAPERWAKFLVLDKTAATSGGDSP